MKSFKEYKVPSNYAAMMAKKRKKAGTSEFSRSDKLSSAQYQKAKKRKSFNSKDWKWDPKQDLYVRVK